MSFLAAHLETLQQQPNSFPAVMRSQASGVTSGAFVNREAVIGLFGIFAVLPLCLFKDLRYFFPLPAVVLAVAHVFVQVSHELDCAGPTP